MEKISSFLPIRQVYLLENEWGKEDKEGKKEAILWVNRPAAEKEKRDHWVETAAGRY